MRKILPIILLLLLSAEVFANQISTIPTKVALNHTKGQTVEDTVFEATNVINPEALTALVLEAKIEVEDIAKQKCKVEANLNIPENYLVKAMTMYLEIDLSTNYTYIYQSFKGQKQLLIKTKVSTGSGKNTPTGNFVIKRIVHNPIYYTPKKWKNGGRIVHPGVNNPYGRWYSEILKYSLKPAGYEFKPAGILTENGIGFHSTNRSGSRTIGQYVSHGCVRSHPNQASRIFPFLLRFIPHKKPKSGARGKEIYPFNEGHVIYVKIYRSNTK